MARRVHSGRAREIAVSALLTKVLLSLNTRLLAEALSLSGCREVNHRLSLMTRFAQHRANPQKALPIRGETTQETEL